jgi:hypothetical protein
VVGNSVAGPSIGYPPGRHYGSPAVALESRSNVEVDCQGVPGRYILHRVGPCTKVDKQKALIGCLSWHRMLCRDNAHTMSTRMVWVKCTTSAECKTIRIAESSVIVGWDDRYLAQCRFYFKKVVFCKMEESVGRSTRRVLPWHEKGSEYLEGTAEEMEWSCLIDLV